MFSGATDNSLPRMNRPSVDPDEPSMPQPPSIQTERRRFADFYGPGQHWEALRHPNSHPQSHHQYPENDSPVTGRHAGATEEENNNNNERAHLQHRLQQRHQHHHHPSPVPSFPNHIGQSPFPSSSPPPSSQDLRKFSAKINLICCVFRPSQHEWRTTCVSFDRLKDNDRDVWREIRRAYRERLQGWWRRVFLFRRLGRVVVIEVRFGLLFLASLSPFHWEGMRMRRRRPCGSGGCGFVA